MGGSWRSPRGGGAGAAPRCQEGFGQGEILARLPPTHPHGAGSGVCAHPSPAAALLERSGIPDVPGIPDIPGSAGSGWAVADDLAQVVAGDSEGVPSGVTEPGTTNLRVCHTLGVAVLDLWWEQIQTEFQALHGSHSSEGHIPAPGPQSPWSSHVHVPGLDSPRCHQCLGSC